MMSGSDIDSGPSCIFVFTLVCYNIPLKNLRLRSIIRTKVRIMVMRMLNHYTPNQVEEFISKLYKKHDIISARDLDLERIASIWAIDLRYTSASRAFSQYESGTSYIFLPKQIPTSDQRAAFFHELCHILRHAGNQRIMSDTFLHLQECQAEHFVMFASMPYFLIKDYLSENPSVIAETFQIPLTYVHKRLTYIRNRILYNYELGINENKPKWSPETIKVLHQLNRIILNRIHYRYYGT